MNILVTGSNGQLGNEMRIVSRASNDHYIFTDVVDASPESIAMLQKLAGDKVDVSMLIPEACKLVLEAGTMGQGGEIYVFDMGKPVKIVNLAKRMIKLSGVKNVDIVFTGVRDGEKLYEEVLNNSETTKPTVHPKIMIAQVREYDYNTAVENEERLLKASYSFDDMEIVRIMTVSERRL